MSFRHTAKTLTIQLLALAVVAIGVSADSSAMAQRVDGRIQRKLTYSPAPVDNPLKGFFPFRGDHRAAFPHSLEWSYFPLNELMDGPSSFTFEKTFEPALDDIASRGHQTVLRVMVDYPSKPTGVPKFLLDAGLKMRKYSDYGGGRSPDWSDERLIRTFETFIAEFGKRYDGDPRIGFITIGLLGFWGEWHTYPHEDWFPDEKIQNRILAAYLKAFRKTRLLMRYPAADGVKLPIGFHDDSFALSTLPTIDWHFLSRLESTKTLDRWKTQPIGGELRPELQAAFWKRPLPTNLKYEDYDKCVELTHCSWLINQKLFNKRLPDREYERAMSGARKLGYDLHASAMRMTSQGTRPGILLTLAVENRGVAPFYYNWPVLIRMARTSVDGQVAPAIDFPTRWKLRELLPGRSANWNHLIRDDRLKPGQYSVSLRVPNPLKSGIPLRFANREQKADGNLNLGRIQVR